MKWLLPLLLGIWLCVAPHAGAWIEINDVALSTGSIPVAPHAGAWIEILGMLVQHAPEIVAPHAGAWIEMMLMVAAAAA